MTDNTVPADKVKEIIDAMNADLDGPTDNSEWSDGYDRAVAGYKSRLEALLPKPRTLADELREPIIPGAHTAAFTLPHLRALADRVETLEKEREELTYAREEGRAAADNWANAARRLEAAEAEIARLRSRGIPAADTTETEEPEPEDMDPTVKPPSLGESVHSLLGDWIENLPAGARFKDGDGDILEWDGTTWHWIPEEGEGIAPGDFTGEAKTRHVDGTVNDPYTRLPDKKE